MANIQPVHSPCYCINYRRAANTLTKYYDAAFAPIGLTGNQFFLLNSIQQLGSCNKSELAQYTSLDRTTIIRNLNTLEKKALVEPAPGASRRSSAIQFSETGRPDPGLGEQPRPQRRPHHPQDSGGHHRRNAQLDPGGH